MKSWLMSIVCAAALSLPMFSTEAQAGVAGKTYDFYAITTGFQFIETELAFSGDDDGVTTDFAEGDYSELDLGVFSFVSLSLTDDDDVEIDLTALQIQGYLIAWGDDSDGITYYGFGEEPVEPPPAP